MSGEQAIADLVTMRNNGAFNPAFNDFLSYRIAWSYVDINHGLQATSWADSLSGEFAEGDLSRLFRLVIAAGSRNDTLYNDVREKLLDDHKDDPAFLTRIGDALTHPSVNARDRAAEFYQMALEAYQDYRRAFEHLVLMYFETQEYDQALETFRTYEQFSGQSPLMGLRRALCLAAAGNTDEAATLFSNYVPAVSGNVDLLNQFFEQLYRQYAAEQSEKLSSRLAELSPRDPDILVLAANWQAEYGQYDVVAELARKALDIEPKNQNAATLLAWASFNTGNKTAALKQLDSLMQVNSDNPETNMYYSQALMASNKDMRRAGNFARMAAGSRKLGMRAIANLWQYYMHEKQYDFAVGTARQAVVSYPDYPLAHYLLGKSLLAYKRPDEGKTELKKAVELGLGGSDLTDARKLLEG